MTAPQTTQSLLHAARIGAEIFTLRPDYRALLLVVENIPPGPSDTLSESLLQSAESYAKQILKTNPLTELPHIAAWRETYKAFGAKPQKTLNSLEALTRRISKQGSLPRVNRLTDIYNAISVKHQIPLGGEDLDKYEGAPVLLRATGKEQFVTVSGGEAQTEVVAEGEPVWCDDVGVTCRRWNWRQGPRTALDEGTTRVLFILDALEPLGNGKLLQAAEELVEVLKHLSPDVRSEWRIISALDSTQSDRP